MPRPMLFYVSSFAGVSRKILCPTLVTPVKQQFITFFVQHLQYGRCRLDIGNLLKPTVLRSWLSATPSIYMHSYTNFSNHVKKSRFGNAELLHKSAYNDITYIYMSFANIINNLLTRFEEVLGGSKHPAKPFSHCGRFLRVAAVIVLLFHGPA